MKRPNRSGKREKQNHNLFEIKHWKGESPIGANNPLGKKRLQANNPSN